jgi:hypothetical protein
MADYGQDSLDRGNQERKKNAMEQEGRQETAKGPAQSATTGGLPRNEENAGCQDSRRL